ncbi:MAG: M14 family zinc carboxypeptidase [Bdellovibrionales bacterium]
MRNFFLFATANGLPIPAYRFGFSGPRVILLGGVHGDEREGVEACLGLAQRWSVSFPFRLQVFLVPALNLDGVIRAQRTNARGVDLNRNMATNDWSSECPTPRYNPGPFANSEPETRALIQLLEDTKPALVISMHSWHPLLNINGDCGREAQVIAQWTGYTIKDSIGYPTPGCLGTYCGLERDMPTLTYEIERGLPTREILNTHVRALEEALKVTESTRQVSL